jgi:hypothetical protein
MSIAGGRLTGEHLILHVAGNIDAHPSSMFLHTNTWLSPLIVFLLRVIILVSGMPPYFDEECGWVNTLPAYSMKERR